MNLQRKYKIKSRVDGSVLFECDIPDDVKLEARYAVELAVKLGVSLENANLAGANLAGANLAGANLADVDLSDVVISKEQRESATGVKK